MGVLLQRSSDSIKFHYPKVATDSEGLVQANKSGIFVSGHKNEPLVSMFGKQAASRPVNKFISVTFLGAEKRANVYVCSAPMRVASTKASVSLSIWRPLRPPAPCT
jgi:hypothetical protein